MFRSRRIVSKLKRLYLFNSLNLNVNTSIKSSVTSTNFISLFPTNRKFSCSNIAYQILKSDDTNLDYLPLEKQLKSSLSGASVNSRKDILTLDFGEAEPLDFPVVWLRDNCRCKSCFDENAQSRIINLQSFEESVVPTETEVQGEKLLIKWDDGHVSQFTKEWLCHHSFTREHQYERVRARHVQQVPWTAKDFLGTPACQTFCFSDILDNDEILLKWLESLSRFGVAHISNTPGASGQVLRVAHRAGFPRQTHYGTEFFVKGAPDASNVAYKTGSLQLHTDLPYYNYMPGVILLHCIIQSNSGGENVLCDGINAAKQLPARKYRILADTVVDWVDLGKQDHREFHSIHRSPILWHTQQQVPMFDVCFSEDSFGNLIRINWSQPQRDSMLNASVARVIEWYAAVKDFCDILHHSDNAVTLKVQPGDILCIDNRRVLHGRLNYQDSRRLLSGAYVDWDEIDSTIRVLRKKVNNI